MEYIGWTVSNGYYVYGWNYRAEFRDPDGCVWSDSDIRLLAHILKVTPAIYLYTPPLLLEWSIKRKIRKMERTRQRGIKYSI